MIVANQKYVRGTILLLQLRSGKDFLVIEIGFREVAQVLKASVRIGGVDLPLHLLQCKLLSCGTSAGPGYRDTTHNVRHGYNAAGRSLAQ